MLFSPVWGFFGGLFCGAASSARKGFSSEGIKRSWNHEKPEKRKEKHPTAKAQLKEFGIMESCGIWDLRGSGIWAGAGTHNLSLCQSQGMTSASSFLLNMKINEYNEGEGKYLGKQGQLLWSLKEPKVGRDLLWKLLGEIWICTCAKIQGKIRFRDLRLLPHSTSKGRAGSF